MSKELVFQSVESLQQVVNVINEAAAALNDKTRTIRESPIPEVLAGALGAGIGGIGTQLFITESFHRDKAQAETHDKFREVY